MDNRSTKNCELIQGLDSENKSCPGNLGENPSLGNKLQNQTIGMAQMIPMIKFSIFEYLKKKEKAIISLLVSARSVYDQLIGQYMIVAHFTNLSALKYSPINRSLIRSLTLMRGSSCNTLEIDYEIIRQMPCIQKLKLSGCDHDYHGLLRFLATSYCPPGLIELIYSENRCWHRRDRAPALIPGSFPKNLLKMNMYFNQNLLSGFFPPGLKNLELGHAFNGLIDEKALPESLTKLSFGNCFDQIIGPNVLPPGITDLRFGYAFDQPIDTNVLPHNLTKLFFDDYFNKPLEPNVLPPNLTLLVFSSMSMFDQKLEEGSLPQRLRELIFGKHFNKPLAKGVLPKSLTSLELGEYFDMPLVQGILPQGLIRLKLDPWYNHPLSNGNEHDSFLPSSLCDLTIGSNYEHQLKSASKLKLRTLVFDKCEHHTFQKHLNLTPNRIPRTVQKLHFLDPRFSQSLSLYNVLPHGLIELGLNYSYIDKGLKLVGPNGERILPLTLRKLKFFDTLFEEKIARLDFCQSEYVKGKWIFIHADLEWVFFD